MVHLNIPLSRAVSTTRHSRRVVWLLVLLFIAIGLITIWFLTLWFTRDSIYRAAPTGTQITTRFFLNNSTSESISHLFNNIPIISSRALTLDDLKPYIYGEFAVFINENGSHSIAIRTNKNFLPNSLLDSQRVTQKQISNSITLLSDKIESVGGLKIKKSFFPPFKPTKKWIGEIVTSNTKKRNFVFSTKSQFEIYLPKIKQSQASFDKIPDNTIAYLSLPILTDTQPNNALTVFLPMIQTVFNEGFIDMLKNIIQKNSLIILTNDENGIGYFIKTELTNDQHSIDLTTLLQSLVALKSTKIKQSPLEDGSMIKEIISDPDSIDVQQITVQGIQVKKVNNNNETIMAGSLNNIFFITNREELLKNSLLNDKKINNVSCEGNLGLFSIKKLKEISNTHQNYLNANILDLFSDKFSYIGLKNNTFSSQINFCR